MARAERSGAGRGLPVSTEPGKKKKFNASAAWREARELLYQHRRRLAVGLALMLVSRLAGVVLPALSKVVIDEVIGKARHDLLMPIALAAGAATVVQAITSFGLSQTLGVAAQRAITDMRKRVQAKIMRLPVRYFDSTQTGVLLSRIMSDAEGIRNLVGTGLVQLVGGLVTAAISLGVLLYINWRLTLVTVIVLGALRRRHGLRVQASAAAVPRTRQDPGRGHRTADRSARRHPHRQELHRREARGDRLHQGRAPAVPQHRPVDDRRVGDHLGQHGDRGRGRACVMIWLGGNDILAGRMTLGDFVMYIFFIGLLAAPLISIASIGTQITEAFAGLDRIREILDMETEDESDATRRRWARFAVTSGSRTCGSSTTRAARC